jgi:hypothetical protein
LCRLLPSAGWHGVCAASCVLTAVQKRLFLLMYDAGIDSEAGWLLLTGS